jgi:hypothetical protein
VSARPDRSLLARFSPLAALVLSLAACGGGNGPEVATAPGEDADQAVVALVHDWYASASPAACEHMTDRMLELGWEAPGDAGKDACTAAVEAAEPVESVVVSALARQGDTAELTVSYAIDGDARADVVSLVRSGAGWLIDDVAGVTASSP